MEDEPSIDYEENPAVIEDLEDGEELIEESQLDDEIQPDKTEGEDELLSWLENEEKGEDDEAIPPANSASDETELTPAKLPSWLAALKPSEEKGQDLSASPEGESSIEPEFEIEEGPQESPEELGPLAGLSGIIPVEPEIIQQGRAKIRTGKLEFNTNQQNHVANLKRMLAKEGAPIEDHSKRIALPMRILQMLFAALLFSATLIPIITGSQIASRPIAESLPESTAGFSS